MLDRKLWPSTTREAVLGHALGPILVAVGDDVGALREIARPSRPRTCRLC
jgi:hypothetical protein